MKRTRRDLTPRGRSSARKSDASRRIAMIEINRYDWPHSQGICFRPFAILRPRWFTRTIKVHAAGDGSVVPSTIGHLRAVSMDSNVIRCLAATA